MAVGLARGPAEHRPVGVLAHVERGGVTLERELPRAVRGLGVEGSPSRNGFGGFAIQASSMSFRRTSYRRQCPPEIMLKSSQPSSWNQRPELWSPIGW